MAVEGDVDGEADMITAATFVEGRPAAVDSIREYETTSPWLSPWRRCQPFGGGLSRSC